MRIFESVAELVGNTPLLHLNNLEKNYDSVAHIYAKLEYFNPAGSVKDRVALNMIIDAEKKGLLKPGSVIIEPTSGNTGIGLSAIAASRGYSVILTMPDTMSVERRSLIAAYGAEIVLTEGKKGMTGAIEKAEELAREIPDSFIPAQFSNPANPQAHESTTGPEIWRDTDGKIDIFVAGAGTGGTVSGVGRFLKSKNKDIKIVAVEPASSAVISGKTAGPHGLQGIGAGFIPDNLDMSVIDEVITVTEEDAYATARFLSEHEGILTGITSGAASFAATILSTRGENAGKTIVALLPDTGERYLSTPAYSN